MRRFSSILLMLSVMAGAAVVNAPESGATVGTLVADYRFSDSLASSIAGAPALEAVGPGTAFADETIDTSPQRVFTWQAGSGLRLPQASSVLGETYTMVMLVRSSYQPGTPGQYAKLVDWHDGMSNKGLFLTGACPSCTDAVQPMFPFDQGGADAEPDTWIQLAIVRHASSAESPDNIQLKTYIDGEPSTGRGSDSGTGPADSCQALVGGCDGSLGDAVRFFLPDSTNSSEPVHQAAGAVARIRIYTGAMTEDELFELGEGVDPEPDPSPSATTEPDPDPEPRKVRVRVRSSFRHSGSPHRFFGVLQSKDRRCEIRRRIRVEDFDGFLQVGTDRSSRRGRWSIAHSKGGDTNDITYLLLVDEKRIKTARATIICKPLVKPFSGF